MLDTTPLVPRGVYRARCLNPDGCMILFAVDHNHRHLPRELGGIRYVMPGENPLSVNEEMWQLLDQMDPIFAQSDVA